MCGGDFLSNHPDEAMDFLNYVDETSKGWDEPNPREMEKMRPSANPRGGRGGGRGGGGGGGGGGRGDLCTFRGYGNES